MKCFLKIFFVSKNKVGLSPSNPEGHTAPAFYCFMQVPFYTLCYKNQTKFRSPKMEVMQA
jgi:hypothetical protein